VGYALHRIVEPGVWKNQEGFDKMMGKRSVARE